MMGWRLAETSRIWANFPYSNQRISTRIYITSFQLILFVLFVVSISFAGVLYTCDNDHKIRDGMSNVWYLKQKS